MDSRWTVKVRELVGRSRGNSALRAGAELNQPAITKAATAFSKSRGSSGSASIWTFEGMPIELLIILRQPLCVPKILHRLEDRLHLGEQFEIERFGGPFCPVADV